MTVSQLGSIYVGIKPVELLKVLLEMSPKTTHSCLVKAIQALPKGYNTELLGSLCIGAAIGIEKVEINDVTTTAGINLPDQWKTKDSPNVFMLEITGHLLFLLNDSDLTEEGRRARIVYKKSLGGSKNVLEFGDKGNIIENKNLSEVLREWSIRLSGTDVWAARTAMAAKFPHLVLPSSPLEEVLGRTLAAEGGGMNLLSIALMVLVSFLGSFVQ